MDTKEWYFPPELKLLIFSYIDINDFNTVLSVSLCCKEWKDMLFWNIQHLTITVPVLEYFEKRVSNFNSLASSINSSTNDFSCNRVRSINFGKLQRINNISTNISKDWNHAITAKQLDLLLQLFPNLREIKNFPIILSLNNHLDYKFVSKITQFTELESFSIYTEEETSDYFSQISYEPIDTILRCLPTTLRQLSIKQTTSRDPITIISNRFPQLTHFSNCAINDSLDDVNLLSKLTNIQSLKIRTTASSIEFDKLPKLTSLSLVLSCIDDINLISDLTKLTKLHLLDCFIGNTQIVTPSSMMLLSKLINLQSFAITRIDQINSFQFLECFSKLKYLRVSNCATFGAPKYNSDSFVDGIKIIHDNCPLLESIHITGSDVKAEKLSLLSDINNLTNLTLQHLVLSEVDLFRFTSIVNLNLSYCINISSAMQHIAKMKQLKTLILTQTDVSSNALYHLDSDSNSTTNEKEDDNSNNNGDDENNKIENPLPKLVELNLCRCRKIRIESIDKLTKLYSLTSLDLESILAPMFCNSQQYLQCLTKLTDLRKLNVKGLIRNHNTFSTNLLSDIDSIRTERIIGHSLPFST